MKDGGKLVIEGLGTVRVLGPVADQLANTMVLLQNLNIILIKTRKVILEKVTNKNLF